MRACLSTLFGALALTISPPCFSQSRSVTGVVPPISRELLTFTSWIRRFTAAQQPAIDSFRRCQPIMDRAAAAMSDRSDIAAQLPAVSKCMADYEAASQQCAAQLSAIEPLPESVARLFKVDPSSLVPRSIEILRAMGESLRNIRAGFDAAAAGDRDTAVQAFARGRSGMVSALDAQIMMLELSSKSAPSETAREMIDLRIVIDRAERVLLTAPQSPEGISVGDDWRALAPAAHDAAVRLGTAYARDSRGMRQMVARLHDARRKAMLAAMDGLVAQLIGQANAVELALRSAPSGIVPAAEAMRFGMLIGKHEIDLLQIAATQTARF